MTTTTASAIGSKSPKKNKLTTWDKIRAVWSSPRIAQVLLLGFSAGIPLALTGGTLQTWMSRANVSLATIGAFTLVGLPYALKFLWAPLLDFYSPPIFGRIFGQRRGWLLLTQILLALAIIALGFSDPTVSLERIVVFALLVAFFSASQDIVVDALRTENLHPEEQGLGAGVYVMGYRLAMLVSGGLALTVHGYFELTWATTYALMAGLIGLGVIGSLWSQEPEVKTKKAQSLREAFIQPSVEYFSRKGALEVVLFIIIYKIGDTLAGIMASPFYVQQGYTDIQIGAITKLWGTTGTIVGALVGGTIMISWGMKRSLFLFGVLQALSNLVFVWLSSVPPTTESLTLAITVENVTGGMGTAAFSALLMRLCGHGQAAMQFAVLSSFMAFGRVLLGPYAGMLSESLGWTAFFMMTVVAAVPGILMVMRFEKWMSSEVSSGVFTVDKKNLVKSETVFSFYGFIILFSAIPFLLKKSWTPLFVMEVMAGLVTLFAFKEYFGAKGEKRAPSSKGIALCVLNVLAITYSIWVWKNAASV